MIHHRRNSCRLCQSPDVEMVFALEPAPLAEAYLPPARGTDGTGAYLDAAQKLHEADTRYPLDVFLCRQCGGVQLLDVIDAGHLFRDYQYTSSMSPDLADHFEKYAASICERFKFETRPLLVDVGSNDGTLLRCFHIRGFRALGVEPAKEIARRANAIGVDTVPEFMNVDTAKEIVAAHGTAKIVTANNVLAHAEEPGIILDGVREVLADDGVFVFEVSYLPDTINGMVFDYFYHEHGVFYTLRALRNLFLRHDLDFFAAERVPTKGGSIRGFAQKFTQPNRGELSLAALIEEEPYQLPAVYADFIARVNARRDETVRCLREYQQKNLRVAGYGASSTTTVLLHHFNAGGFLDYLVDDNEARQGLVSPGYHLPVCSPNELYGPNKPDAVLITAWRFADAIIKRHRQYLEEGGVFLQGLPFFREVTA